MMSKTHITVGIATSLVVCRPTTLEGIFASVIGGAAGGIVCDIECRSTPQMRDALYGRFIALGICISLLLADIITNAGIWASIMAQNVISVAIGIGVLLVTCIVGRFSEHRTFTHSLLYSFLITKPLNCWFVVQGISVIAYSPTDAVQHIRIVFSGNNRLDPLNSALSVICCLVYFILLP